MNRLPLDRRAQILSMLTEGNSLSATSHMAGVSFNTVSKLLLDVGEACADYQDRTLVDLPCANLRCDEIWSFVYTKAKKVPADRRDEFGVGDVWTWTAICADTKLVLNWFVGQRTAEDVFLFVMDLKGRLAGRPQMTTNGHPAYKGAIKFSFADDIDWAVLQKYYETSPGAERRCSPPIRTGCDIGVGKGEPDPEKISTSFVERQNHTMRMGMRRFTRLTNGFSNKVDNHMAAIALHFMRYNFARAHTTLANAYPRTPAMAVGVADHIWTPAEIVKLSN